MRFRIVIYRLFGLFIVISLLFRCAGIGEPKVIIAYRFYNDSNDTIEIFDQGVEIKEISDSSIFEHSKSYHILKDTAKKEDYRQFIKPNSFEDIGSIEYWKTVIKEHKLYIAVLNIDSLKAIQTFKKGLVKSCVIKLIPLNSDSLEKNDYTIHFKK